MLRRKGHHAHVGPKADGTIADQDRRIMNEMGAWLKLNGEAIYDTRPWKIYGEGPTKVNTGHHSEQENKEFGPKDFRFTSKDDVLYATALAWPVDGLFTIESLARKNPHDSRKIKSVNFVSGSGSVKWKQTNRGLVIQADGGKPCETAYVFRIQFQR